MKAFLTVIGCCLLSSTVASANPWSAFNARLDEAVDRQDWAAAIAIVDQMIVRYPNQRASLNNYRLSYEMLNTAWVPSTARLSPLPPNTTTVQPQQSYSVDGDKVWIFDAQTPCQICR